jgi:hypothetical protein
VVKNVVRALAGGPTCLEISNVALDHAEVRNSIEWGKDFVEIRAMACRVVVDTDNYLAQGEQILKKI